MIFQPEQFNWNFVATDENAVNTALAKGGNDTRWEN
jgi:hypothetical protein